MIIVWVTAGVACKACRLKWIPTFGSENFFLPADFRQGDPGDSAYLRQHGDAEAEYRLFFALGVDGVFSDFPDAAVQVRDRGPKCA